MGVDTGGAGDQGMMFGYATNETPEMLPIPFAVATYALKLLDIERNSMLTSDAKSQVSYDYEAGKITTFLISTSHKEEYETKDFYDYVKDIMIRSAKHYGLNTDFDILINPTGRFVVSGAFSDSGLTGRKIIADTYGGIAHHGGGAFSGKDCTKVDRSGAYMARKVAKEIVQAGMCDRCEVQVAYAIGVKEPVSLYVDTFGTEKVEVEKIYEKVKSYDWTPTGIIKQLNLKQVDYTKTSVYGHFGKDLPWE
jgi:S-adenosylmethionine synthetase